MPDNRLIILGAALMFCASLPARAELTVHIIDVGQAASAIVELDHAAILIDAGGEDTGDDRDVKSIRDALKTLFERRTDLHNTIEAVIVSHPHIDHTRHLEMVMKEFTVRALVDNGDTNDGASGMKELKAAREIADTKHVRRVKVADSDIPKKGMPFSLSSSSSGKILLLSGFRNCNNENNDSITVLIRDGKASALFAGDAESEDKSGICKTEPLLQHLVNRFGQSGLLQAKLYHATHHGSHNGVLQSWMDKVHPSSSIISAGRLDPENRKPGAFHAFQFGHPRNQAIDSLIENTSGSRITKQVSFMTEDGGTNAAATPTSIQMNKAVYCTCWDGNLDVTFAADGTPSVEPLGPVHTLATATAACKITSIVPPVVKPPDSVKKKPADYHMLSLSWSPQFCTTSAGASAANKFQCKDNSFGMVVHGLWPQSSTAQNNNDHPRNCKTTTVIATPTLRQHLCTVPGTQLMQDEWAKHGTCAFDAPENYLDRIETLRSGLRVPDLDKLAADRGASLVARDVTGAFVTANPGLSSDAVQLLVDGKNLSEVHVCYSLDFKFRKCDTKATVKDTAKVTIRPVVH